MSQLARHLPSDPSALDLGVDMPVDPVDIVLDAGVNPRVAGRGALVAEADHAHQLPPVSVSDHQRTARVTLVGREELLSDIA